jgi:endonuclease-3
VALSPSPADVARRLRGVYGRASRGPSGRVLEGLVGTILSQNTTSTNAARAYEGLRRRFPEWPEVAGARLASLEAAIRPAGLARQRSRVIRDAVRRLLADDPSEEFSFLREAGPAEAMAYLTAIPGVGPKTAACVLLFDLGKPAFPVDTHILRIARRLGWLAASAEAAAAQAYLEPLIPARLRLGLHVNLIAHGRTTCRPRGPGCGECVLAVVCARAGLVL